MKPLKPKARKRRSDRGKKHRVDHTDEHGCIWYTVRERAQMNGVSASFQHRMDKLASARPDLLDEIARTCDRKHKGKALSVARAIDMMEAGLWQARHDKTPHLSPYGEVLVFAEGEWWALQPGHSDFEETVKRLGGTSHFWLRVLRENKRVTDAVECLREQKKEVADG